MAQREAQGFGKYQLLEKIASGGMAEIYRARYQAVAGVTKPLVIKKILPAFADNQSFVSMFVNEAKIAVGLSHGNIAQVFDFGEIDGEYFLAMEFVHGQALSKVIKRARAQQIPALPIPFALLIASEMCKGLHYAHTRLDEAKRPLNIIHRDVSPQNVIVSYEGQVKVVDFGIAKARTAGRTETEAGAVKGKYLYFAPEQARGKPLDGRCDLFATGVVLYEMLCGRLPFQGKMIEVLGSIVKAEFPRPRKLNPEIPEALEQILLKALAKEPEDRYPTAQAFGEALTGYLYSFAPTFSAASLQDLMTFLFEDELRAEGVPVHQAKEILEQVPLWRRRLPQAPVSVPPAPNGKETAFARPSSRHRVPRQQTQTSSPRVATREAPKSRKPLPRWAFLGIPVLTALFGVAVAFLLARPSSFTVKLLSDPPGASIRLDGRPLALVTPTTLTSLSADSVHHLELTLPGMKPWRQDVRQSSGVTLPLFAQLERLDPLPIAVAAKTTEDVPPEETPPSATRVAKAIVEKAPKVAPVKFEASYPVDQIRLVAKEHVVEIPSTSAARTRLNPAHAYRVRARGIISLGGALDTVELTRVTYFLEGTDALAPQSVAGQFGDRPVTLRHAKMLYAFVFDETPEDNGGAIQLDIEDLTTHRHSKLLVDGRAHAVDLASRHSFMLRDLAPLRTYELTLHDGNPAATTRAGKRGQIRLVGYEQNPGWQIGLGRKTADLSSRVLEVGKTYEVTGVMWMRFVLMDDQRDDNGGELRIDVIPTAGGGGYLRGLGGG